MATNTVTLSLTIKAAPYFQQTAYPYGIVNNAWAVGPNNIASYGNGTAAGSIDSQCQEQLLATTSGASIQLNGGSLTDLFGGTFNPVRLDFFQFYNAGTVNVTITGTACPALFGGTTSAAYQPGAFPILCQGFATNSTGFSLGTGTNSTLIFTSTGGTSAVQLILAGRSV